jgi:hypothetical protein
MGSKIPPVSLPDSSAEPQPTCAARYRAAVARAKALQAIATTLSLRRYLDEVIAVLNGGYPLSGVLRKPDRLRLWSLAATHPFSWLKAERGNKDVGKARRSKTRHSIVTRDRTALRRGTIAEIEHDLVDITPPPALGRIVEFDDWVARLVKMLGGVAVRRVVTAADMATGPA